MLKAFFKRLGICTRDVSVSLIFKLANQASVKGNKTVFFWLIIHDI